MAKQLLFSVTIKDCDMQTFTVHGHGGGGKDTSRNGVRLTHRASGAVGEGRDHRSLTQNRRDAFARMANTDKFKAWHKLETSRKLGKKIYTKTPEQVADEVIIKVEEFLDKTDNPFLTTKVEDYRIEVTHKENTCHESLDVDVVEI